MTWRAAGAAVVGGTHLIGGKPCQDAVAVHRAGTHHVVAVADGHGSRARSDRGARFAVEAAVEVLDDLGRTLAANAEAVVSRATLDHTTRRIVWEWTRRARRDAGETPDSGEWSPAVDPYGSTLIATLVAGEWCVCWQIGDGDLLCVGEEGGRVVFPDDDAALLGSETRSLCTRDAVERARAAGWRLTSERLFLLCTDGVRGARDDEALVRIGAWYRDRIAGEGWSRVLFGLVEDLGRASRAATGDDATMALLYRGDEACEKAPG